MKGLPRHFEVVLDFAEGTSFQFVPLIYSVSKVLEGVFAGEPLIISLPLDTTAGFPTVMWSQTGIGSFSLGGMKAALSFDWATGASEERTIELCSKLADCLVMGHSIPIKKISVSVKCDVDEGPSLGDFVSQYCNPQALGDIREIVMAWKTPIRLGDVSFDDWVRYESDPVSLKISKVTRETSTASGRPPMMGTIAAEMTKLLIPRIWREASGVISC